MNNSRSKTEKQLAADAKELDNCGEQLDFLLRVFFMLLNVKRVFGSFLCV